MINHDHRYLSMIYCSALITFGKKKGVDSLYIPGKCFSKTYNFELNSGIIFFLNPLDVKENEIIRRLTNHF